MRPVLCIHSNSLFRNLKNHIKSKVLRAGSMCLREGGGYIVYEDRTHTAQISMHRVQRDCTGSYGAGPE